MLWDAVAEALITREAARREACALTERAHEEAGAIRAAAAARGRDEGLASVAEIHAAALRDRDRLLEEAREELVELAFAIAERVIGEVVRAHPQLVVETAARAVEASRGRLELTIRARAEDLPALREAKPKLASIARGTPRIRFEEDASVARGDVLVDTELGRVEASVEAQLRALRRVVLASSGGEP